MSSTAEEMKKEILDVVSMRQQENERKIDEMKDTLEQMRIMMQQMILTDKSTVNNRSESDRDDQPVRRSLNMNRIPDLMSPVTAAKQSIALSPLTTTPLPHHQYQQQQQIASLELPHPSHASLMNESTRSALQKGMSKPPTFEGNVNDNVLTWWRQVKNYAMMFDAESQASLIKSYLRGPAALWYDSRERELGRELSLEELANGLSQEYGSETTSQAALQKLESLTMANEKCSTLQEYNTEFSKYYNLLNTKDQTYAVRCYIKGIAPKYLKYVVFNDTNFNSLAEAKAAVTLAVAKHEQLEIAYANYQQQKGKSFNKTSKMPSRKPSTGINHHRNAADHHKSNNNHSNNNNNRFDNNNGQNNRRWESTNPYRVALSSLSDTSIDDEEDGMNEGEENERKEGQVAVVSSSQNSSRPSISSGLRLTNDQINMLRNEYRCFRCHEHGHRVSECKNIAATKPPLSLKEIAPSRRT
jgi:hypothetical protein